jgi:putative SOS response-associated peptidase YedK
MCSRYALSARAVARLAKRLRAEPVESGNDDNNLAPGRQAPVAVRRPDGLRIALLRWGLPSPWRGTPLLQARSETVAVKPVFRELFRHRRCLVPAEAFYEWQAGTRPKQPWRFAMADDMSLAMAGLWQSWRDEAGREQEGFLLLTTSANPAVAACHDRMPVLLSPGVWEPWLDADACAPTLQPLLRPWSGPMTAWPVTTAMNRADYAGPVTRVEPPAVQAELFGGC